MRNKRGPAEVPVARLLPPVVRVLSPDDGLVIRDNQVSARIAVRSPSGEQVTLVKVLVHGRLAQSRAAAIGQPARKEQTLKVTVPSENSTVAFLAETPYSSSAPALLHLRWAGRSAAALEVKPKLYLLVVGVSKYRRAELALEYPAKDARDLAAALKAQQGKA